jgi:RNA polymerase sigma-70 factor (ECF subfamily)
VTTWLYAIASNVVLTGLRGWRRQRRLRSALEAELESPHTRQTPEDALAARQELLRVWKHLLEIKPKKRIVYLMFELEGLSGPEIAAALDVPEATVWTRLHHARRELAGMIERDQRRSR